MASGIMLTRLARDTSLGYLIASYVTFGIGSGLVNPPITNAAVSGMPRSQAGVAAGIASTSRQVGTALGVAVLGSVALSSLHGPFRAGFAQASHVGWWIIAACGAAILVLGLVTSGRWARTTAERTASLLMPATSRVPVSAP
jgi:MFS family permease